MPLWAVSASIIATVVSAVTFVSVPAAVFAPEGNLVFSGDSWTGARQGRSREAFGATVLSKPKSATSYEYIGARIDARTGQFSMALGLLLNTINAGVKLLTASLVLDVISGWGLAGCAASIVSISALWGTLAGIKNRDLDGFLLFLLFAAGAVFALLYMLGDITMSLPGAIVAGYAGQAGVIRF